ncbi:MAG: hypothetical protein ACRD0D_01025 [Acidimicrobiales bacterium]
MADTYDSARANVDEQRRALLAAMARYGSEAARLTDEAASAIAQDRRRALAAVAAEAGAIGAPQAVTEANQARLGGAYDRYTTDLAAARAARGSDVAAQSAAGESYLAQASAAVPVLAERTRRALEERRLAGEADLARARLAAEREDQLHSARLAGEELGLARQQAAAREAEARAGEGGSGGDLAERRFGLDVAKFEASLQPEPPRPLSLLDQLEYDQRLAALRAGEERDAHRQSVAAQATAHSLATQGAFVRITRSAAAEAAAGMADEWSSAMAQVDEMFGARTRLGRREQSIGREVLRAWLNDFYARG